MQPSSSDSDHPRKVVGIVTPATTPPTEPPDFGKAATRRQVQGQHDYIAQLHEAMADAGMPYTGKAEFKTDETFNRWDEKRRSNGPLWCCVHPLNGGHVAAYFGDWRIRSSHRFLSWECNGHDVDPNEAQRLLDELDRRHEQTEKREAENKRQAAKRAQDQWSYMPETGSSAYLERKQVQAFGIRYGADWYGHFIAVPMRNISGSLRAFQRIYDDGTKRFPKGSEKKGCYHLIGELDPTRELYLAEGYATASSVHQATGKPVAVCFDAGNLRPVADAFKGIYPELQLIVAADNDQWKADEVGPDGKKKGNTGVKSAYAVAYEYSGTRIASPSFDNLDTSDKPTDFNDLARLAGPEHVARQLLEKAFVPKPRGNGEDKARDRKTPIEHSNPHQATVANRRYSLKFAVEGQQPQSLVAKILAEHNSGLAYDHVAQKWMLWKDTQWKVISDSTAFKVITGWIDAGLDGDGYTASFANGVVSFLKSLLATDGFDDNPRLVPFQNGVLDLSTMKLMDHSPGLKISWCLPFDYDPAEPCEPVKKWMLETVGGDDLQVELLRAYIKAVITGRYDLQRYLELIGPGGTGKGVFTDLCVKLVGKNNVHVTELKHLETNRFETARLYQKRLCIITDAAKYAGDVATLKAMTGADDLRFEEKHKQGGEAFKFQGMVLIAANQEIGSSDLTSGLQRRRITVRFDNQVAPTKRRNLEKEFEPYLPGVIAWALSMDDARMKEFLIETDAAVPMVGGYNLDTLKKVNPLAAWADERLILDSLAETPVGTLKKKTISDGDQFHKESWTEIEHADEWLYPSYVAWCEAKGNRPVNHNNFTGLLKDLLCCQIKIDGIERLERAGSKLSRFKGIRLRAEEDKDTGNLIEYGPVRPRYGIGTALMEESTASTAKSKLSNTAHVHVENKQANGNNENAYSRYMGENLEKAVPAVPAVPNEENQGVRENQAVPEPYRTVPEPYGSRGDRTPDHGTDSFDSLVADFSRFKPVASVTPTPSSPTASSAGVAVARYSAVAAPPVQAEQPKLAPHCKACQNFRQQSWTCPHSYFGISMPNDPPCKGTHFEEQRS